MSENTGLSDVLEALMNKINTELNVSIPGVIEKYDFKTQKANVRINIKPYQKVDVDFPIVPNVPLVFPRSGGASLTMPVKKGDGCLLVFSDLDAKSWLLGADNVKPQTSRRHHLTDAIAIIGLNPFTKPSQAENNEDVLLSYSDSKIRLKPNGIIDIHNAKEVNVKTESVIINCKNAQVKSSENVNVECKNASIKSSEATSIDCKTASIKASDSVSVDTKTANLKASENANIECQNATVKASGAINTETPNFTQKGNMKIDGNIEITGTSLLKGKLTSQNGIENSGANLVSNGKTFETHTHSYQDVTTVTAPDGPCAVTKVPTNSGQTQ
jgi:phage gp45-like